MFKGLVIILFVIGCIFIGCVIECNGKWLFEKDDQFIFIIQVQICDGWVLYLLDDELCKVVGGKLWLIFVQMLFNDFVFNLCVDYLFFDCIKGWLMCVGNGEICW